MPQTTQEPVPQEDSKSVRIPEPAYTRMRALARRDGMIISRLVGKLIEEALDARGEN